MEEEQVGNRIKKWVWIPIGVLVGLIVFFSWLGLTGKQPYTFSFLNGAEQIASEQNIYSLPSTPDIYQSVGGYRLKGDSKKLMDQVDKELVQTGWKKTGPPLRLVNGPRIEKRST